MADRTVFYDKLAEWFAIHEDEANAVIQYAHNGFIPGTKFGSKENQIDNFATVRDDFTKDELIRYYVVHIIQGDRTLYYGTSDECFEIAADFILFVLTIMNACGLYASRSKAVIETRTTDGGQAFKNPKKGDRYNWSLLGIKDSHWAASLRFRGIRDKAGMQGVALADDITLDIHLPTLQDYRKTSNKLDAPILSVKFTMRHNGSAVQLTRQKVSLKQVLSAQFLESVFKELDGRVNK